MSLEVRASIDLGTNTCLLLIAEWANQNHETSLVTRIIGDYAQIVRLGEGVDQTHELNSEAMERALQCLKHYAEKVHQAGCDPRHVICVATSQARDAQNGKYFFDKVEQETGFHFRILRGEEEAHFSFLGALLPEMNADIAAVIDVGGGSTEFISKKNGKSLDIGSVRFTERYLRSNPVSDEEFWHCQDVIDLELKKLWDWRNSLPSSVQLVAVAGTATTLATWYMGSSIFEQKKLDGLKIARGDFHRMVEELKWRTIAERRQLNGIDEGRADVILAGAMILWRAMEVLDFPECIISTRGLRFGVLSLSGS